MPIYIKAIFWALAILFVAVLSAVGVMPKNIAETLIMMLPMFAVAVLMVPATASRPGCRAFCRKERA